MRSNVQQIGVNNRQTEFPTSGYRYAPIIHFNIYNPYREARIDAQQADKRQDDRQSLGTRPKRSQKSLTWDQYIQTYSRHPITHHETKDGDNEY